MFPGLMVVAVTLLGSAVPGYGQTGFGLFAGTGQGQFQGFQTEGWDLENFPYAFSPFFHFEGGPFFLDVRPLTWFRNRSINHPPTFMHGAHFTDLLLPAMDLGVKASAVPIGIYIGGDLNSTFKYGSTLYLGKLYHAGVVIELFDTSYRDQGGIMMQIRGEYARQMMESDSNGKLQNPPSAASFFLVGLDLIFTSGD